jgi:hypothetical protein
MGFREIADFLIPSWLTDGEGGLKVLTFTTLVDASIQRVQDGLDQRFPTRAGDSGLALIGLDRGILRGRTELAAHYAERLKRWRWPRGHRTRGTAYALLEQVSEYWGGARSRVFTVRGRVYERSINGEESWHQGNPIDWDGSPPLPNWGRFWVMLGTFETEITFQTDYFVTHASTIGLIGFTPEDADALRGLMRGAHPWKPAGVQPQWLMIGNIEDLSAIVDSTWAHWSKLSSGTQVNARSTSLRYIDLGDNNRYSGNPAVFCVDSLGLGGFLPGGDPNNYPESSVLPGGIPVTGNPNSFPMNVKLLDDGDAP